MRLRNKIIEDLKIINKEYQELNGMLRKELTEEKNAYNRMYNMYVEKDNIINELKWKPIEEYDKGNYDWVLVKYFDKDYECVPCVAEKRFDKWYNRNDEVIEFDVKYFMDMQQIDKLQELKGSDKE